MQEIYNFLLSYWKPLLGLVLVLVSLVLALVRKKPVNSIVTAIYLGAIEAIKATEETDYKGSEKLQYCVGLVLAYLDDNFPGLDSARYYKTIVSIIESILETPQKKGGK